MGEHEGRSSGERRGQVEGEESGTGSQMLTEDIQIGKDRAIDMKQEKWEKRDWRESWSALDT